MTRRIRNRFTIDMIVFPMSVKRSVWREPGLGNEKKVGRFAMK
jgi:hypothetical protein